MYIATGWSQGSHTLPSNIKLSELTSRDDIDDTSTDAMLVLHNTNPSSSSAPNDVVINVHSGILRVASPFFMRVFNDIQQSDRSVKNVDGCPVPLCYTLETPHPYAVQRILYYIYKNDYQNVNEETRLMVPIYQESSRLGLYELKHSVLRLIRNQHNLEVLANLSYAADSCGEVELARDCGRVLADSAYAVFSCELLQQMGLSAVKALVESDNVQLDEVQIFTALCHFLEQSGHFMSPYSSSPLGPKEKDFLTQIRYCSMPPKAIDRLRHDNLSPLLLDAVLRILQGMQKRPRHFPWTGNSDYSCMTYNGLFPVLLVRASKDQLSLFDPNSGNPKLVTPHITQTHSDTAQGISFTMGTEREISIGWWAYEVSRTERGNVAFGIAFASQEAIDDASRACYLSMSRSRRIVFYYDFFDDTFKSGYIDPANHRKLNSAWSYEAKTNKPPFNLKQRDIVTVNIIVATGCITLTIGVLDTAMTRTFQIPHRATGVLGSMMKRPSIIGAPFFIMQDIGDSLSIPEFRADINV
ncbi:GYF domain-containing protein protein, putative [Babesia ovis]|uniref:GYF domain-containing protein protein, putative n=1 Tax=Babesia ovis TaxID=5869 RepID=A0A9W5TE45_BABOV|nr:GYF domain-containing protein protein, putative [Babesia ovis]